ncbi:HAD family hydrolase [Ornithinicoccus hortensis]|uniref:Putative hydrolase of the HAD superfamily n=1 Tax=Ornithinicoccus hortensis TaxID=82346 RepID=A0A542YRT8_9MICO|nr:HAD family hydrolase [Ornithinicoccus hortensis]TQL50800.1 putative hydrolase of the HAD superfamily [Ornithinicoccus hortensis]
MTGAGREGAPVRAVIFDWGGTLTPWHPIDPTAQWLGFARALHGGAGASTTAEELAATILAAEGAAWARGRDSHTSARLEDVLVEAGVDTGHPAYATARLEYERFWEPHTFTDPQVRPLWEWLRAEGVRVGVLSNTMWTRDYHRAVFARDGVLPLIDGDVYSSEIDWAKPHPEAFRSAAAAVDTDPAECVYVGDRLFEDVHGPQQVGMRAVWIPHSEIPAEQVVEVEARPDAVAHSLAEIAGIVRGWTDGAGRR